MTYIVLLYLFLLDISIHAYPDITTPMVMLLSLVIIYYEFFINNQKDTMSQINDVLQFNKLAQPSNNFDKFDVRSTAMYFGLIGEELIEGIDEIFKNHTFTNSLNQQVSSVEHDTISKFKNIIEHLKRGSYDNLVANADRIALLDSAVDVTYVGIGCGLAQGVDMEAAFAEVQRSNMSKVDSTTGTMLRDTNGKVTKPASYSAPDLASFVKV